MSNAKRIVLDQIGLAILHRNDTFHSIVVCRRLIPTHCFVFGCHLLVEWCTLLSVRAADKLVISKSSTCRMHKHSHTIAN